ncbi:single-stranded DNA-binding protein [Knoellia sp. p5-6-4]|uniref:single-stranded DNA-binding protein n=1 Tax=unclassified Knoellia TaxID=2618719 RepID=UPI0023DC6163|nr:single-stranded DNA-binding protein [Knoellia sp. p5-6-4]MDF2145617.1 single-stranded DNA-binding protein [Knoellia sp. p5-6-4]
MAQAQRTRQAQEQAHEAAPGGDAAARVNEVHLVGRVSGAPEERSLPSGDAVVLLRLVVRRSPVCRTAAGRGAARGPSVDTIDVACWGLRARRAALRLHDGDAAEVSGSLHRRFFRAGGAAASRYEVAASSVTRART